MIKESGHLSDFVNQEPGNSVLTNSGSSSLLCSALIGFIEPNKATCGILKSFVWTMQASPVAYVLSDTLKSILGLWTLFSILEGL